MHTKESAKCGDAGEIPSQHTSGGRRLVHAREEKASVHKPNTGHAAMAKGQRSTRSCRQRVCDTRRRDTRPRTGPADNTDVNATTKVRPLRLLKTHSHS